MYVTNYTSNYHTLSVFLDGHYINIWLYYKSKQNRFNISIIVEFIDSAIYYVNYIMMTLQSNEYKIYRLLEL